MRNLRRLIDATRLTPAVDYFARAAYLAVASAGGKPEHLNRDPHALAKHIYGDDDPVSPVLLTRAAVSPGKTTTSGWAAEIAPTAFGAFLVGLGPLSAAARIIAAGLTIPLQGINQVNVPQRSGARTTLPWVAEDAPIPVDQFLTGNIVLGPPRKYATIVAFSADLARRSDAENVFNTLLREDAGKTLDSCYFADTAGSASAIAGLLYGLTATPITGGTENEPKNLLMKLAGAVSTGGSGQVLFITGAGLAAEMAIAVPEQASRILASQAVADTRVIAVDPLSLVHGFDDAPEIAASREAVLHMSDDPDPLSEGGVADPMRSLWQTDAIALRVVGDIAFAKRRSGAVAFAEVSW